MKNILLIVVFIICASLAHAQKTDLWVGGGVTGSSQIQTPTKYGPRGAVWGPALEVFVRAQYPTLVGYETGLFYTTKGTSFPDIDSKVLLNYVGAYVNILIFFPLKYNSDIYIGPGVFVANAISGKNKTETETSDIEFGETWKSLDAGLDVKIGVAIKDLISIGAHYDIGLLNSYKTEVPTRTGINKGKNSSFTFFVAVKVASIKKK